MNKKAVLIVIILFVALGAIISFEYFRFNDGKLHVIFCDVGQGDGIFIRSPSGKNILVDAGPDNKIISCIERNTPFWERTISLSILTHPHADHFTGFNSVLRKYRVEKFVAENIQNDTESYISLNQLIAKNKLELNYLYSRDMIGLKDGVKIKILGPSVEFINQVSPERLINSSTEQATLVMLLSFGEFDVLLTGDAEQGQVLSNISESALPRVEILKVPHHGSKTGLNSDILNSLSPKLAVISVGSKNKYGHPAKSITDLLNSHGIPIQRTDKNGDIELVSDGKSWGRVD